MSLGLWSILRSEWITLVVNLWSDSGSDANIPEGLNWSWSRVLMPVIAGNNFSGFESVCMERDGNVKGNQLQRAWRLTRMVSTACI